MIVIGCDPGTEKSAIVVYDSDKPLVLGAHHYANADVLELLSSRGSVGFLWKQINATLVIEEIESYGMAVGREVFVTVRWTGRFEQAWGGNNNDPAVVQMPRRIVKQHLCHTARATDANIRQALIDRFGPGPEKAVGLKKTPGPLYAIKGHAWSALAVAVTYADQRAAQPANQIRPGVVGEF